MKRQLLENVKVLPYENEAVVDRDGFLSASLGVKCKESGSLSVVITHCDTEDGTFSNVADSFVSLGNPINEITVDTDEILCIDIDLLGCKRYIKFKCTGVSASCALALGDKSTNPV